MHEFNDYFNQNKRYTAYKGSGDEIKDYLRLLDMLLEGYLEFKGLKSEQKLFSRGLVITETEMERYFMMPPGLREQDLQDPLLTLWADNAWEYIAERTALTINPYSLTELEEGESEYPKTGGDESIFTEMDGDGSASDHFIYDSPVSEEDFFPEVGILWIDTLKKIFSLGPADIMAVIMALAPRIDRKYERIFGFLQDDISRTTPTIGLLEALMARVTPRISDGNIPHLYLNEENYGIMFQTGDTEAGLDKPLILIPFIERILMGTDDPEEALPEPVTRITEEPSVPLFFNESAVELTHCLEDSLNSFCYVESSDEDAVLHLMSHYCSEHGEPLFVLDMDQLMRLPRKEQIACISDLALRTRLMGARLMIRFNTEELRGTGSDRDLAARRWHLFTRIQKSMLYECIVLFGEAKEPGELIRRSVPFLTIPAPDVLMRTEMWKYFLIETGVVGISDDVKIEDLADCYDISYSAIKDTCNHVNVAVRTKRLEMISRDLILESLGQLNQIDFSGLASPVRASYTWDDISITDDQRVVLKLACDRYRLRNRVGQGWGLTRKNAYGNGVSLLLYGPPGTGKTMAAQVVANELGIPLYRVDISQIFSKYVGETEKNLSVIFNAAKGANVILFFDEADALFSRRTEISSSNDKYANSETAYLLQKIEEYDGMSILATNHYTNFDPAFVRRITYSVRLDNPDEEVRYVLWTGILPEDVPTEKNLPFRFLAEHFELTGSNIKAILFSAAYMAGAEEKPVGMCHIVRAIEYEYRKLGRYINREDFGPYSQYLSNAHKNGDFTRVY